MYGLYTDDNYHFYLHDDKSMLFTSLAEHGESFDRLVHYMTENFVSSSNKLYGLWPYYHKNNIITYRNPYRKKVVVATIDKNKHTITIASNSCTYPYNDISDLVRYLDYVPRFHKCVQSLPII